MLISATGGDGAQIKMIVLHNLTRVEKIRRDLHTWTLSGGRTPWKKKGEERETLSGLTAWAGEARAEWAGRGFFTE